MKYLGTITASVIYIVFAYIAANEPADEEMFRKVLAGTLFIGGIVSGFLSVNENKKGILFVGYVMLGVYIAVSIIFDGGPLFMIGAIILAFFHGIFYVGWHIGSKALK